MKILWKKSWKRLGVLIWIQEKQMEKQEMVNWKKIRLFASLENFIVLSNVLPAEAAFSFSSPFSFSAGWLIFFTDIQKRPDGGKQGATPKKSKKDKAVGATAKARTETVAASGAPRVKPELALPVMYI